MADHPTPSPCAACGGASQFCYFGQTEDGGMPHVFIVAERPMNMLPKEYAYYSKLLAKYVNPKQIFWTGLVKCMNKSAAKAASHCKQWLEWEIRHYKPALVLTVGAELYHMFTGRKNAVEGIGQVRLLHNGGHYFWHMAIDHPNEIAKLPEREFFQNWAVGKIPAILRGEYPKKPTQGKDYRYATNLSQVKAWCDEFQHASEFIALDTEGGGKDEHGLSVALDPWHKNSFLISLQACVVPGHAIFFDDTYGETTARKYLLDFAMSKWQILHNATHDYKHIREKWGLNMWPRFYFDTMLADHALREWDRKRNLNRMADLFLPEFEDYERPLHDWFEQQGIPRDKRDFADAPRHMLAEYGAMDPDVTLRLFYMQSKALHEQGLWDLVMTHIRRVADVYGNEMHHGWGLNKATWQELRARFTKMRLEAVADMHALPWWEAWRGHREVDLKAQGLRFWDNQTQAVYQDSQMYETHPYYVVLDNGKKRNYGFPPKDNAQGSRVKKWTYTPEDLEPSPSKPALKREILYDAKYLGLVAPKKTDAGDDAVNEVAFAYLKKNYANNQLAQETISAFTKRDKADKFLNTFVEPAYDRWVVDAEGKESFQRGFVRQDDGVHPDYMLAGGEEQEGGTNSGRPSSKNPNQLNIPSRDQEGKKIKKMYIPIPRDVYGNRISTTETWEILQFDYSQLELRILTDQSNDPFMVDAYLNDKDLHTQLAVERFGKPLEWFQERLSNHDHPEYHQAYEWRQVAKTSWFAFIYGAGAAKLIETLAKQGVWYDKKTMQSIINGLRQMLPQVEALRRFIESRAPVATTRFGRRRFVLNVYSNDEYIRAKALRQLFNFSIQSEGADTCSRGMYLSCEWLKKQKQEFGLKTYPMGGVYDSFVLATPASETQYIAKHVKQILESPDLPWTPRIPFKVDVEKGPNWGDLEKLEV